ncbi:MAG: undecaprenyl-diphosphate phosphatase [Rhizobiales bacterium]|nr:undecaprenyl-diphosphate phosphatase [Hyphomicrobiales bacterium]MBI3673002.1 undecaprenyl-diphosphate phosphatase [Hyphomicrobiales bacterium]
MTLAQIIVLALIQGTTEFLPISSSGHLILVPVLTGWKDQGVVTDMVTNLGTLFALIVYFWRDVVAMLRGLVDAVRGERTRDSRLVVNVVIGTLPILAVGALMKYTQLDEHIRSATLVAVNAIGFGVLLYVADFYGLWQRTVADMNWKTSLIIGSAQALSLSPGTSRSGITMTAARGLGFVRPEAARFSFLLSMPANGAASIFIIGDALKSGQRISGDVILTGVLTFFIALGTITVLMRLVRHMSFLPFSVYRVVLGFVLLGLIYSGVPLAGVN